MPLYDYNCSRCNWDGELQSPIFDRDGQVCPNCGTHLHRQVAAPLTKIMGRVTPGGGMDRFTADMLGVPLAELPSGLKTKEPTS